MATLDVVEADSILAALFGDGRAASRPDEFEILLLDGDPRAGGDELPVGGGYARVTVPNTTAFWGAPDGGAITSDPVEFTATAAWLQEAFYWAAADPADPTNLLFSGRLEDSLEVTGAGPGPRIRLTVSVPLDASYLD